MSTVFAGLMCHAPIVVPEVGRAEAGRCRRTTRAMREVARRAALSAADRVVLVSPHSPRHAHGLSAWRGVHRGDLAAFGAPDVRVDLPDAPEVAAALGLVPVSGGKLDHGAVVPLAFLQREGWHGPTAILALPMDGAALEAAGRAIAALPGRTAVIASGDMSHRLQPGAPAGYHPRAQEFDRAFVHALSVDAWDRALDAPDRDLAAEDVVDSTHVAMAAAGTPKNAEMLAYEGPWGVGYTEAVLLDEAPPLYAMARMAVRDALMGRPRPRFPGGPPASGVFVSMHLGDELKGCVGSISARHALLHDEVVSSAILALQDGRMDPPTLAQLPDLTFEVSLLSPLERVDDLDQLDPRRYGVVVTCRGRRGLLLPDLEGVDTVEQQLRIACRKAGIAETEQYGIDRFTVEVERSP